MLFPDGQLCEAKENKNDTTALVLPQLAGNLFKSTINRSILKELPNIHLVDPLFSQPLQIDLLIGANILPSVLFQALNQTFAVRYWAKRRFSRVF